MTNFVISNDKYIISVDFGHYEDIPVQMTFEIEKDKSLKIIESKILHKEDFEKDSDREKYFDYCQYLIDNYLIGNGEYNDFFYISENPTDRENQIKELRVGDYIECYNGNRGVIQSINFPYFNIHLKDSCIIVYQNIHMMDIKKVVLK